MVFWKRLLSLYTSVNKLFDILQLCTIIDKKFSAEVDYKRQVNDL